jgi:uncharacterized protein (DUF433 family)
MAARKTAGRNQAILSAFETGVTVQQLVTAFGITEDRVRAVLHDEKNKRIASQDAYYRERRSAKDWL